MFRNLFLPLCFVFCLSAWGQEKEQVLRKLSPDLTTIISRQKTTDSIDVSVSVNRKLPGITTLRILASPSPGFLYVVRLPVNEVLQFAQQEQVLFVSQIHPPKEEITTGASDPTLDLITYAQHRFPEIRGEAVVSSVKERLFDTTDIDLKGRVLLTGLENTSVTAHASLMATIMAGAGNSSPFAKGAAPAAVVSSSSFTNLFPDPDSVFRRHHISLQNHSYGTTVENFYGNEAVAYDQSTTNNPQLLHVFSAGNDGTTTDTTGPYAGVTNMANLSGNFKQAKNIITVSAVDSAGQNLLFASKGPAYDGRVKPELVAYGEDGSSGAAALVSGAAILVQDLYSRLQAGSLPSLALVKAVLLNSADNNREKHVNYLSGYGLLNTFQALQTVNENRFFESSVLQNETKTFSITVPDHATQLKLTLTWNDLPAAPNASKALVNDLDLVLTAASGESWLPWVLSSKPVLDSLLSPAQRRTDTLNNVEQITVDNPTAGVYTIKVNGSHLQSSQAFALAYQIDTANTFYWTYPTATDPLIAGRVHSLRWHTNLSGPGKVEYATNGNNWRTAGDVSDLSRNYLKWSVPDTVTTAQLRLVTTHASFASDTFTISPQQAVQTGFICADSFLLYWNALPVQQYRLYQLGEKYLEPVTTLTDTVVIFSKTQHPSGFYSIAPLINGREGIRSNAANYAAQGVGCYLQSFYLQLQTETTASFIAGLGTVYNVAEVGLEKFSGSGFVPLQTITHPQTTVFSLSDSALHQGANIFRLRIKLANGSVIYSDVETVYAVGETMPVLFYPNPVSQGDVLKILTREVGRYTLHLFDATGKEIYQAELNSTVTTVPANRFAKGLYFIRIVDKEGRSQTVKQIIL
jgi:hypothetical protein